MPGKKMGRSGAGHAAQIGEPDSLPGEILQRKIKRQRSKRKNQKQGQACVEGLRAFSLPPA